MKSKLLFSSRIIGLGLLFLMLAGGSLTLTSLWTQTAQENIKRKKGLTRSTNDPFTPKEHCIRKIIYLYKKHFIKWFVKHKVARKIRKTHRGVLVKARVLYRTR